MYHAKNIDARKLNEKQHCMCPVYAYICAECWIWQVDHFYMSAHIAKYSYVALCFVYFIASNISQELCTQLVVGYDLFLLTFNLLSPAK